MREQLCVEEEEVNLFQRLYLRLNKCAFSHYETRPGWMMQQPIFYVRCDSGHLFQDYPHGWDGHFHCPTCRRRMERYKAELKVR